MNKDLNVFVNSIDAIIESNKKIIELNNSIPDSDLDLTHKLVALSNNLNLIIKNQEFILNAIKGNVINSTENRSAILNIIDKIDN